MPAWLYQMSTSEWNPEGYRRDIWEGEQWRWVVRNVENGDLKRITDENGSPTDVPPQPGDTVFFFFAQHGQAGNCLEPGFYGLAIVLRWENSFMFFRPVAPSDQLKMRPLWDNGDEFRDFMKRIRPGGYNGTLWRLPLDAAQSITQRIFRWVGGQA